MPASTGAPTDVEVRELRRSSRLLVRVLGVLQPRLEDADVSPAQCHALLELAGRGRMTTGELAEVLEVDKSTASRTLRPLLRKGLLEVDPAPDDQRTKPVRLTGTGRRRVRGIEAVADAQVRSALELLSPEERASVLSGISLYERALHRAKALAGVVVRPIKARDNAAMARVVREVMAEYGAVGCGYSSEDAELERLQRAYAGPGSAYFVAERDGEVVAGGGIAPLAGCDDDGVCELRKMHALSSARGLGIGRKLLERCLEAARAAGYRRCYLETLERMHRARALYQKFGFQALDAPLGDTGHFACDGWYALDLDSSAPPRP